MTTYLKGTLEFCESQVGGWPGGDPVADPAVYGEATIEAQSDKPTGKLVPCTGCAKPLYVNAFYAPAIARCAACGGQAKVAGKGQAAIVQAGRTDPAKSARLEECLVNPGFALAICPAHPDAGHEMELKSLHHNDRYGPNNHTPGEVAMHQCKQCLAVVTYSTSVKINFRRCNEAGPRDVKHSDVWANDLGTREEVVA